jgi:NADPH:quinone reductase-like Zn-dependent oxidoreductase
MTAGSATTTGMVAVVQRGYGSADVLAIETVPTPVIGPDEVLIQVRAASVNHADWVMTSGTPVIARLAFGLTTPKAATRGKDVAGVVVAVGAQVTQFRPGDEVYGELPAGGFAGHASAPASRLELKPSILTFEQAAAVPLAANTALQGLRDAGRLQSGQTVLINGASGGVGTFAVQIAKALGAEVTAVCSARNAELVRSLGADHVLDYNAEDFAGTRGRYDLVFDLIGNRPLRDCVRSLRRDGTLVLSSGTGSRVFGPLGRMLRALVMAPFVSQRIVAGWTPTDDARDDLRALLESGQVVPAIDRVYPLAEVPDAIRYFAEEHASGKVVIAVG